MPMQDFMIGIIQFIQSFSNPFLDSFFQLITMMGEDVFFILAVALVFWCIDKNFGYKMGFAYLTCGVINTVVKEICRIPRPIGYPGIRSLRVETASGYSFPSGHTQQAAVFWYSMMLEFRKRWLYAAGIIMILLVSLSRMYLGVHTLLDVAGGALIGLAWIFASNWLFDWSRKKEKPELLVVFVLPMLAGLYFFPTETYYKVAGTIVGFWVGYIIEFKYIHYEVRAAFAEQAIKLAIGLAGLLAIKTFGKLLLPQGLFSDFVRYSLLGIWMTVVAPLLFRFIPRKKTIDQGPVIHG